jgi:methyl-accepting chemotaxis protein
MKLRWPRVSLKWKIFGGCFWLTVGILVFNFIYASRILHRSARASFELEGVYRRYQSFQKGMAQGLAAAVDVWAGSRQLRDALGKGDDEAARPLVAQLESSLVETMHPDFVLVIDKHGDLSSSAGCPIDQSDARSMRLFADLKQGLAIRNAVLEHKGRAYLVSGAPVMRDTEVVGEVLIGQRLERLFAEFKSQSDDDPKKQVELALVHNQLTTASAAHSDDWDDIARATRVEAREVIDEGGEKSTVVRLPDGRHDFFAAQLNGYDGGGSGSIGQLYVLRNRLEREAHLHALVMDSVVVALVALVIALLAAFILSVIVARPLNIFIDATRDLAHGEGDLTRRIPQECTNSTETSELADNLNKMFANLQQLTGEVQSSSFQVGASSAEISAASKQMLSGAKDQAQKIESSTAAVTELSSSIQQVAENALQATKVARESGDGLTSSIGQLQDTRRIIEETADKIQELGQSGKRIGSIVDVIRQISEQTSLLALNASIEAAHAGELGRGFAVVADEVSSLARRVGQSAKDIEALIGTISEQTVEAVSSMQNVTRAFSEHVMGASQMQGSLKQIVDTVQDTARSVQEQAVVSDEIARNMDAVQKIAQEVLGASEEAVVQGEALHALALKLEQLVRGFRIDEGRAESGENGVTPSLPRVDRPALPPSDRRRVARG